MDILSFVYLAWIAITVMMAWILPQRWQIASVGFLTALCLSYYAPLSLLILTGTSLAVYYCTRRHNARIALCLLSLGILVFLWSLFKFYSKGTWDTLELAWMPLGMSYYTFRQIHYILESLQGGLEDHRLSDYLCYLFFLPSLQVGPIHRFPEFLRDIRRRRWDSASFSCGLERVLYGYAKIVILGNYLISNKFCLWASVYSESSPFLQVYFGCLSRWLNLYFQFSGYSDIAIGFSLLIGFRIRENFDSPLLASNIVSFWQRWHISLTSWCKDYIYMPIASLTRNGIVAIALSMIVLGLWHDFSFRYVFWGLYQAIGIAVWHKFQTIKKKIPSFSLFENRYWKWSMEIICIFLTLHFVFTSFFVIDFILGYYG